LWGSNIVFGRVNWSFTFTRRAATFAAQWNHRGFTSGTPDRT
jgi:hypothetical protein